MAGMMVKQRAILWADQKVEQWVAQSERYLVEMKEFVGVDWLADYWA